MKSVKILIASLDDALLVQCLEVLKGAEAISVVGQVQGGLESIETVQRARPGIVLLDVSVAGDDLPGLIGLLRAKGGHARILLLVDAIANKQVEARVLDALSAGAHGYLTLANLEKHLVKAVRSIDEGEAWVPRKVVAQILERLRALTQSRHGT